MGDTGFETFFPQGVARVACRPVLPGDAERLMPEERPSFAAAVDEVRSRAAAARIVMRRLLELEGIPGWSMPRRPGDAPAWPTGFVGSLSHSDTFAAAALARSADVAGLGIDIEPAEPLPAELRDLVALPGELRPAGPRDIAGRLLFCAKEAAYKAVYPADRRFLEHHDIEVDLRGGTATTCYGRVVSIQLHVDHRIIALAVAKSGA